jgi:hypothetical protein
MLSLCKKRQEFPADSALKAQRRLQQVSRAWLSRRRNPPSRGKPTRETELDYSGFETGGGSTNGSVVWDG